MTTIPNISIKTTQFKRGLKEVLESRLVSTDLGVLLAGEPAFETDTGQLKIGNGVSAYIDLPYVGSTNSPVDFIIEDPVENQILIYDESIQAWVNKDLTDKESIVYLTNRGLTIKGYDEAHHGDMLVKDQEKGLTWRKPLTDTQLQAYVAEANVAKNQANDYAVQAGNAASSAETAKNTATRINQQTMNWFNNKFWWGSIEEFNSLTAISPDTFYFIRAAK